MSATSGSERTTGTAVVNPSSSWQADLRELLAVMQHPTLTRYVRCHPYASLLTLSMRLGAGAVTPLQLLSVLVAEATTPIAIELCARDLLVRAIHGLPAGWPMAGDLVYRNATKTALNDWVLCLAHPSRDLSLRAVARALEANTSIPRLWKPVDMFDPVLVRTFNQHWESPRSGSSLVWPVICAAVR
jgi:hypothetical protein